MNHKFILFLPNCSCGYFQGERGGEGLPGNQGPPGDTPLLSPKGEKVNHYLTLNVPIATMVVCFSRLLNVLKEALMANSVDPDQTAPIGSVCSGSTLFASILNLSVMKAIICSRRLQKTTFSDAFFLGALRVKELYALQGYFGTLRS